MSIATEPKSTEETLGRRFHLETAKLAGSIGAVIQGRSVGRRKLLLALLLAAAAVLVIAAVATIAGSVGQSGQTLVYYTVQRTDLPITVTERGNLESQDNVEIVCEVDDVHGDGIDGTAILSIVPNGSSVKKEDLLVELDVTLHRDRLDTQVIGTERAKAEFIQAEAKYENQKTQNVTMLADAKLQVELANLKLQMFSHPKNGSYKLELEEINRAIDDVKNEITEAQASLALRENEKRGIEALFKLGYAGKSELDRTRLEFLQAEGQLAARLNRLETQQATLAKKATFERQMEELQLRGDLATAERDATQVERNNIAMLAQTQAAFKAAQESLKKEEERLARSKAQIENSKIYAPQDGMVAYASGSSRWSREEIREGSRVRLQQKILTLPNLSKMQVKTAVHESVLDQIQQGLSATVRVDAFPNHIYKGSVQSVAVLPDQGGWMSSDTKVYETYISIDETVERLKPGMTAVVEIDVKRLSNVLSIPVQSVVQVSGDNWCYVDDHGDVQRRSLKLGVTNDKFVEIHDGLTEGERVVLNPTSIMDDSQRKESAISPDGKPKQLTAGI